MNLHHFDDYDATTYRSHDRRVNPERRERVMTALVIMAIVFNFILIVSVL